MKARRPVFTSFKPPAVTLPGKRQERDLLLLVLAALAALFGLAGWLYYRREYREIWNGVAQELAAAANLKASQVETWYRERLGLATTLARNAAMARWAEELLTGEPETAPLARAEFMHWFRTVEDYYGFRDLLLVDAAGQVEVCTAADDRSARLGPYALQQLRDAARTGQPGLSDFHTAGHVPIPHLDLVVPLLGEPELESAGPVAFLMMRIDPWQYLYPLLETWPGSGRSAEVLLVRREGERVVYLNPLRHKQDSPLRFNLPSSLTDLPEAHAVQGWQGLLEGRDYRDVPVLAAVRPIPHTPWFLVAKVDRREALAPLRHSGRQILLAAGGATVGAGALVLLAWLYHTLVVLRRERELEARYRNLFEAANDAILIHDLEGRILEANPVACARYGYSRTELLALSMPQIEADGPSPAAADRTVAVLRNGAAVFETVHRRRDGSTLCVEVSSRLIEHGGGPALLNIVRDVSERKEAQQALERERNQLLTLINNLPDLIYIKDRQGRFVVANQAVAEAFGVATPEAVCGKTDADFQPPALARHSAEEEAEIMRTGIALVDHEEQRTLPSGKTRWLLTTKVPLRAAGGEVVGLVGIGHDITQRKEILQHLRAALQERAELEEIINRSPAVAYLCGTDGDWPVEVISRNVGQWGYTPEDFTARGLGLRQLIHPDDREPISNEIERRRRAGEEQFDLRFRVLARDGETRWVEAHAWVRRDAPDGHTHYHGVLMDVTERSLLQEQLYQAQKMESIGRLAGGVAHEFNNVLQAIWGYTELLLKTTDQQDPRRTDLLEIDRAARRARDVTSQLLAFSRKQMITPRNLSLNDLLGTATNTLLRLLGEDIRLETDFASDLWPARVDAGQIEQVVMTMAVNARDAMPNGGTLTLATRNVAVDQGDLRMFPEARQGRFVCLMISDTGVGIAPEHLPHMFEPFFSTKGPGRGTGLGLATAYGIVKQHEGWINVYSQVGKGTTFKVYLPAVTVPCPVLPEQERTEPAADWAGRSERILVVEDEDGVRNLAARVLCQHGYAVWSAPRGLQAWELFQQTPQGFDLVLCDVVLPDMNGLELVERLVAAQPSLRVIMSSGYSDERSRWPVIRERGYRFLPKPYPLAELLRAVRETLDRRRTPLSGNSVDTAQGSGYAAAP